MTQINFNNRYNAGSFTYTWHAPNESTMNEGWGMDANRAVLGLQCDGDQTTRRNAAWACLEYPIFNPAAGAADPFMGRNIPLGYPVGTFFDPDAPSNKPLGFIYASKFLGGRGIGPRGQEAPPSPLPLYDTYVFDAEFTDRSYDILPDSAVLGPGALSGAPTLGNPMTKTGPYPSFYARQSESLFRPTFFSG